MRFRVETHWSANRPYRLFVPDGPVEVRHPVLPRSLHIGELHWTWGDGTEFTLTYPMWRRGKTPTWQIIRRGETICHGRLVTSALRDAVLRCEFPVIEWEFKGQTLLCAGRGCRGGGTIEERHGQRLAMWRPHGRGWDAVCRDLWGAVAGAAVAGTILAWIHDH